MANKSNKCQRYDGYAMLMIPNNDETALHGCYYLSDKALRMRYWSSCVLVCVTCIQVCLVEEVPPC